MHITINDEVYTLDGLIKAYKLQLEALEKSVDDRMLLALSNRMQEDSIIKRLLCNELQYSHSMREAIADHLNRSTSFADMIVGRAQDRILAILEDKVEEMVRRNLDAWWDRRHSEIKAMVASQINSDDAAALRREGSLKTMLQLFLGDSIKETVKEEVSGRVTELSAQPTLTIDSNAVFIEPMYPVTEPESRSYHYRVEGNTFRSLELAKQQLRSLRPGVGLYFIENDISTKIFESTDTFEIHEMCELKPVDDTSTNLMPALGLNHPYPNDH